MSSTSTGLTELLRTYRPATPSEARDVERLLAIAEGPDGWDRSQPLHATGSAVVVHPPTKRVLLRWHERMKMWLQVGGHGEPGEDAPFRVAAREAAEETGLADLTAWPDATAPVLLQVVVVPVPAGKGEPAHEHGDLRFLLATSHPEAVVAEHDHAPLRWLDLDDAIEEATGGGLAECLRRASAVLEQHGA